MTQDVSLGAHGDARPEVQMMRALADLGRREAAALHRPHEVLMINVGDDPARLVSAAAFMHTMVQSVARQGHRFASVDPKILTAAAADETTAAAPQIDHRVTLDAKVVSYSVGLKEAYKTAKFGEDPARARQDFEDVLSLVSAEYRPVVIIDDTEHFVHRGVNGGVDTESVSNLFHHAVRALAELDKVDVVVAIHPKYRDVPAVAEVTSRFGFLGVDVPALRADSDSPGLGAVLTRRLERHGIDTPVTELIAGHVISQLEAYYFTSDHDLRAVLDLAAAAAGEPGQW